MSGRVHAQYYILLDPEMTHLCSVDCSTNYHHNLSVSADLCTYYGGVPDIIQVGEHQFIEKRVLNLFIRMMLVAWYVCLLGSSNY